MTGTDTDDDLERRIESLEERVAALEARTTTLPGPGETPQDQDASRLMIDVRVTNKRYDAGVQPHIWFDCTFTAVSLERPARAAKGGLEFCDLFGEPMFIIGFTLNDRLEPGRSVTKPGIGFAYNEFMGNHQWMLGTQLEDMTIRFRVDQIIYEPGDG